MKSAAIFIWYQGPGKHSPLHHTISLSCIADNIAHTKIWLFHHHNVNIWFFQPALAFGDCLSGYFLLHLHLHLMFESLMWMYLSKVLKSPFGKLWESNNEFGCYLLSLGCGLGFTTVNYWLLYNNMINSALLYHDYYY